MAANTGGGLYVRSHWETAEIRQLAAQLSSRNLHRALAVGINASAKTLRGRVRRDVAKAMGIRPQRRIDKSFKIDPWARDSKLYADVVGTGRPLPLHAFKGRQGKAGATADAWEGRKTYKGSFVATMASGHTGIFKRKGAKREMSSGRYKGQKRQPIVEMWGPGVAKEMSRSAVLRRIEADGQELLTKNTTRQLRRYLFQQNRGA